MNRRRIVRGTVILLWTFLLVFVVVYLSDPLRQVQARSYYESIGNSAWLGGFRDGINLPASITPEEVLRKYFPSNQPYTIIEVRKIGTPATTLYAALVEADGRRLVVLLQHLNDGWMACEDRK